MSKSKDNRLDARRIPGTDCVAVWWNYEWRVVEIPQRYTAWMGDASFRPVEPERCEHGCKHEGYRHRRYSETSMFERCCSCGTILSDRRKGERRVGGNRRAGIYTQD